MMNNYPEKSLTAARQRGGREEGKTKRLYHEPHKPHKRPALKLLNVRVGSFVPKVRWFVVKFLFILVSLFLPAVLSAQEGFGFGDSGSGDSGLGDSGGGFGFSSPSGLSVNIGGQVQAELYGFYGDMDSASSLKNIQPGNIFTGYLNFDAAGSAAEAVINLKLTPVFDGTSPVTFDEAFVRAFFGPVTVEGGLRKLTWGKADSFSPLDVINPLDYTDLTKLSDPPSIKLPRPMIHAIWSPGSFTKLEAVFVPWFQGDTFSTTGRWTPSQMTSMVPALTEGIQSAVSANPGLLTLNPTLLSDLNAWGSNFDIGKYYTDHYNTLDYAQGGMRFTTTIGSSDLGLQYYFGRFLRPSVIVGIDDYMAGLSNFLSPQSDPNRISINVNYNYYHQIAADFATVIAGFNIRAEAGANITSDLDGTDGTVENPAIIWSLGFDRDLFAGINLNLQGVGKVRLFYDKIGNDPLTDCEAGTDMTSTRITAKISRKFFRDELELRAIGLWGIEDKDFLILPGLIWSRNDVSTELSAGFFGGDKNGELGQYRNDSFIRVILSYSF